MKWVLPFFLYNEQDCLFYDEKLLKIVTLRRIELLRKIGVPMDRVVFLTTIEDFGKKYNIPAECQIIFLMNEEIGAPWDVFRSAIVYDGPGTIVDPHYPLVDDKYLVDLVENGGEDLFVVERASVHPFYLLQECGVGGGVDFIVPRHDNTGKIIIGRQQHDEIYSLSTSYCRFRSWTEGLNRIGSSIPAASLKVLPETRAFSLAHGLVDYYCIKEIEKQELFFDTIGDWFTIESLEKLYGREVTG